MIIRSFSGFKKSKISLIYLRGCCSIINKDLLNKENELKEKLTNLKLQTGSSEVIQLNKSTDVKKSASYKSSIAECKSWQKLVSSSNNEIDKVYKSDTFNKAVRKIKLDNESNDESNIEDSDTDELIESRNEFKEFLNDKGELNVIIYLKSIQRELDSLSSSELETILKKILIIGGILKKRSFALNYRHYNEFIKDLRGSSIFKFLLDKSMDEINQLNPQYLIHLFRLFIIIDDNVNSMHIKTILSKLDDKLVDLDEIADFLKALDSVKNRMHLSGQLNTLFNKYLKILKGQVMSMRLDDNIDQILNYLKIFLANHDLEAIDYLTRILLRKNELSYDQAVFLLKNLKNSDNLIEREREINRSRAGLYDSRNWKKYRFQFPESIKHLASKCNLTIYKSLIPLEPTDENAFNLAWQYLTKTNSHLDKHHFHLSNYYNPKVLELVTPILIANYSKKSTAKYYMSKMAFNYSRYNIYNKDLLKFIYDLICSDQLFRMKYYLICELYPLICRYRFNFVDYQKLADYAIELIENNKFGPIKNYNKNLRIISEFILMDVHNEKVIDCFNHFKLDLRALEQITDLQFKVVCLANAYLIKCSKELDDSLKNKIKNKLEFPIKNILKINKKLSFIQYEFIKNDPRIQKTGYLSNGINVGEFAIYDKSIQDLIPIVKFKSYFFQIDKIPLEPNQELIFIFRTRKPIGNIEQYENNYDIIRKIMLNQYKNFKTLEVPLKELKLLSLNQKIDSIIRKIQDGYAGLELVI